jgi:hypothetical protein
MVAIPTISKITNALGGFVVLGAYDLSNVTIPLSPAQQTALGPPTTPLTAVGVAFGVQNYTCSTNNVFVSTGAVAELLDISNLASNHSALVSTIHEDLFTYWTSGPIANYTVQQMIECFPKDIPANKILAQHYFVGNEAGGLSPVWDFRATPKFEGVENATFVGKALANISDADPTKNVPWLHLGKVGGEIADEVYRIFTVGGVAPSSCVGGTTEDISVKYTSQYWFHGGSLGLGCK